MEVYRDVREIVRELTIPCVTIGNFDGVHLGHQRLFREVVGRARQLGGTGVALTFDPHPLKVLRPDGIKLISNLAQKVELIEMAGIDVLLVLPFTPDFASTSAECFVAEILVEGLKLRELVVGYDYAFGKGRRGNIEFLRQQGVEHGYAFSVVDALEVDGMVVSSSKIRELIGMGKMGEVRQLLGRPYQIRGEVQRGRQRGGRVVGFPTANLRLAEEDLCPRLGVYVVQVIYGGRCYGGVLNIGHNPTFGEEQLVAETHIFDFDKNIYGHPIKLNLLAYLRSEQCFSGPEALADQIRRDIASAHAVLDANLLELVRACGDRYNA